MSESEIEDENILSHFQEVLHRATGTVSDTVFQSELDVPLGTSEYACLRSMMLEPQNPTMWNALALVHMMSSKHDDAEEAIERSLDIDTSNSWTWTIWGDLLRQEGRVIESERAYQMAVELEPENEHALRQLISICDSRKANPETLHLLETLLPISPDDQELWDLYSICLRVSLECHKDVDVLDDTS